VRKTRVFAVDYRAMARNWWGLLVSYRASFEGRREGDEGQGAGVVQQVWMGVEMWEMVVNLGMEESRRKVTVRP
jgi:hypothetical protein